MPTVRGDGQTKQRGHQNASQIKKTHSSDMARDDLDRAYAGDENNGPASNEKTSTEHDSHLSHRKGGVKNQDESNNHDN